MSPFRPLLSPRPRRLVALRGALRIPRHWTWSGAHDQVPATGLALIARELDAAGARGPDHAEPRGAPATLRFEHVSGVPPEGYRLLVHADGARIQAGDGAGTFYGCCTLAQLLRGARHAREASLPMLAIEDEPVFRERGALLDVSRCRVPRMDELYRLIDQLASSKLNQLQLYVEHTFRYEGHEEVWRGWSPLTPAEMRTLDTFCRERFVELVPNQQSFGHMHRWLVHDRYRPLAECPEGVDHAFSRQRGPFSLCPTDPRALELVDDLHEQLLACCTSRRIHVGCDETFDLGTGRSAAACRERGVGRMYLDYLLALHERVAARGHRMLLWADVLLRHPELVPELPRDCVPLLWGYEADHPFARETDELARSGLDFLVCPGTSSWLSLGGRVANMTANVAAAARHAARTGARGLLVTDWGDRGHLQAPPISAPGWLFGAEAAWGGAGAATPEGLAERLDRFTLDDTAGRAGTALVRLGGLAGPEGALGAGAVNASPLGLLVTDPDTPLEGGRIVGLTAGGLERAEAELDEVARDLVGHRMAASDGAEIERELLWTADVLRVACGLGRARLEAGGAPTADLPEPRRARLADALEPAIEAYPDLWAARSRPGGLERSRAWLRRLHDRLGG